LEQGTVNPEPRTRRSLSVATYEVCNLSVARPENGDEFVSERSVHECSLTATGCAIEEHELVSLTSLAEDCNILVLSPLTREVGLAIGTEVFGLSLTERRGDRAGTHCANLALT
jgi:hypothetical protein